jgi:hypothetical protein
MDATAMTDINEAILKASRRGHLRWTPEQKQALVEAYEASGLSCPRFAALHGVNCQTLVSRFKKSRQGDPRMESSAFSDKCHGTFYAERKELYAGMHFPLDVRHLLPGTWQEKVHCKCNNCQRVFHWMLHHGGNVAPLT